MLYNNTNKSACCIKSFRRLAKYNGLIQYSLVGESMIISVAGNISSGKSTLAKKISSLYGFSYVPSKRSELNFLSDFFDNIPERFFATQTSFLISKILEIEEEARNHRNIVIDRSLFEDIHIFAQLWMDNYAIDAREKSLYKSLSDYIMRNTPKTDVYIFCKCENSVLTDRFAHRPRREFENKYPDDYLEQLCDRYNHLAFPDDSLVVELDSEKLDLRQDDTVMRIMGLIEKNLNGSAAAQQLSLFDALEKSDEATEEEEVHAGIKIYNTRKSVFPFEKPFRVKRSSIYVAAPFTEFANEIPYSDDHLRMDTNAQREYFMLPKKYQNFLSGIKKHLRSIGNCEVILPHKDENDWGKTYITSEQVVTAMINNMNKSDLIVAIVSNSIGVYMEIAMMAVQNKPMVLFVVENLSNGFYANGFKGRKNVLVINIPTIESVSQALKDKSVTEFIRKELRNDK